MLRVFLKERSCFVRQKIFHFSILRHAVVMFWQLLCWANERPRTEPKANSMMLLPSPVAFAAWLLILPLPLAAASASSATDQSSAEENFLKLSQNFDAWLQRHSKSYTAESQPTEYTRRLAIYAANLNIVQRHNAAYERGYTSYAMSVDGPFADLTGDEFSTLYLMEGQNCSATHISSGPVPDSYDNDIEPPKTSHRRTHGVASATHISSGPVHDDDSSDLGLPKAMDWRTQGVVTPIKSQGHCGSCWTFSTSGTLEAHYCIAHNKDCTHWKGLAEQQLVDCAGDFNNHGCSGGLPSQAFEYIHYSGGMALEESYKYKAKDGVCHEIDRRDIGAKVRGVHNISTGDEDGIVRAVAKIGPVAVAFDVSPDFRLYSHGVYDSFNATTNQTMCLKDPQHVNHAVVAVGYGETMEDTPVPYHIIRNSWGNAWGMEGYFWMKRGENMCGISDCASYPLVRDKPELGEEDGADVVDDDHSAEKETLITAEVNASFSNWIGLHQKSYQSEEEYQQRLLAYATNAALVDRHNDAHAQGLTSYQMKMDGPFSDLTFSEFEDLYLMEARDCYPTHTSSGPVPVDDDLELPKFHDWRTKGVITPIKSQGHCGSCWTFASTGTIEAHHCIAEVLDCSQWTGLAEQQLVDCAGGHFGNAGCGGGWPSTAMEYIHYVGGIVTEDSYRYTAKDGKCRARKKMERNYVGAKIRRVHNITSFDEDDLVKAVAHIGPVAVAFDVANGFHLYSHGVYDAYDATTGKNLCKTDIRHLNHAVVAVGFGWTMEDEPKPYHIIRNSWGNTWGMEGYFSMLRGKNLCGVSDCAAYPDVVPMGAYLRKSSDVRVAIEIE